MGRLLIVVLWLFSLWMVPAVAQEPMAPLVAFQPSVRALDDRTLEVRFEIAPDYYLYRDKIRFTADEGVVLGVPEFPPGVKKDDETFGSVEVFYKEVRIRLPVERNTSGPMTFALSVTSQGCAEALICYPPQTQKLNAELPAEGSVPAVQSQEVVGDESGLIAATLARSGFWTNVLVFFMAGLGLAFTPCVLPMIPILSGIIVGQGEKVSRGRAFGLSVIYVMGMALTYSAIGVAAGLTGTLLSGALQNVWVLSVFAAIFVLLALSMFGFYELQLPSSLQSRLSEKAGSLRGGKGIAVFIMGIISALIIGPCVAAPLAGALIYIGKTGDAVLGGTILFAMAWGMGVPLLLVGLSAGTLLPRTGAWMEGVKKGFGVILLATAIWVVSPVLPVVVQMLAYGILLVVSAIYLHALDPLPPRSSGWLKFWKGIGIVMLLTGAALLIGTLAGSRDPLQPLAAFKGSIRTAEAGVLAFERVKSVEELEARLQAAGRPVMLDFYADWCVSCKEMERFTFAEPEIKSRMDNFILLQADVTGNGPDDKALLQRFNLFGPPGIIFFDAKGQELDGFRVIGFQNAARFGAVLDQVLSRAVSP